MFDSMINLTLVVMLLALVVSIHPVAGQESEIVFHGVEYRETKNGVELLSWRQVNLRKNTGRKYGVTDSFFAEHAPRYHVTVIDAGVLNDQISRSVHYIVKGKTIEIPRTDIESDKCYSLSNFSLIERLRKLAARTGRASPLMNKEVDDFVDSRKRSGYVVVEATPEMVQSFIETRKQTKEV